MIRLLGGLAAAVMLLAPLAARADFHVVSPYEIDLGELEIEHNGSDRVDHRPGLGGQAKPPPSCPSRANISPIWASSSSTASPRRAAPPPHPIRSPSAR